MKNLKLIPILVVLLAEFFVASCVEDDDFDLPDTTIEEPILEGDVVPLAAVIAAYEQAIAADPQVASFTFEDTTDYTSGFIISTDEAGNFFEELIIQDTPQSPTHGIKIRLDVADLFTRYEPGRRIFVRLNGLSVGLNNGVITLGVLNGTDIEPIPEPLEEQTILRSALKETLVPTVKTLSQLTESDVNTLIQLSSAQFTESQLGLTFASEEGDAFDGDRTIESCDVDGGSVLFQTSTFADYSSNTLPEGAGTLTAILSKDFFGEQFVLAVRSIEDLTFDGDRCEPTLLNPNITATTTFAAVIERFLQNDPNPNDNIPDGDYATFGLDEKDLFIEGYVISSDQSGNFFEELVIQNAIDGNDLGPNNPRLGLRVFLDRGDLYQTLPVGRKVYIKLNGLAIDVFRGNLTLGAQGGSSIQQIAAGAIDEFVIPGEVIENITPLAVPRDRLNRNNLNTLVTLQEIQFTVNDLGLTFAGESTDQFDGIRTLESCEDQADIALYTSTFATFRSIIIPEGKGAIRAIYTNNFEGEERVLEIRNLDDIDFNNPNRCDPPIVDCGLVGTTGTNVLFSEFFETQTNNNPISGNGLTNFIEEGTQSWEAFSSSGTNNSLGVSASIGSFNSGDLSTISWLVLPEVNYDLQTGETLNFKTSNSFSDASTLELLFSSDWDGTPANIPNATWAALPAATIVADDDFFGDWINSGTVDLSCINGTGHIAFRYRGSGEADTDGTYELDEIEIRSN